MVTGQKDVSRKKVRGCGDVGFGMWRGVRTWRDVMWCGVRAKELSLPPSLPPQFFSVLLIAPHSSIWTPRTDSWTLIFFSLMPKSGESVKTCFSGCGKIWTRTSLVRTNDHIRSWSTLWSAEFITFSTTRGTSCNQEPCFLSKNGAGFFGLWSWWCSAVNNLQGKYLLAWDQVP